LNNKKSQSKQAPRYLSEEGFFKPQTGLGNRSKLQKIMSSLSNKRAQTITLDLIIGVTIFLSTIVLFYYLFSVDVTKTEEEDAANAVVEGLSGNTYFRDEELDSDEVEALAAMDCSAMKEFFNTNKNICIYATDKGGNLVELNEKVAAGCPGIKINDVLCGSSS